MKYPTYALALLLTSCAELTFPANTKGRTPTAVADPAQLADPGELAYLQARRLAAGVEVNQPTLGVAFSGGGVRSATVNLGSLQALEEAGVLKHVDYLSCVSGGSYIGGWYVSHLRTPEELALVPDQDANFTSKRADLLELGTHSKCYAVHNVRDREGLFGKDLPGAWSITKSTAHWLGLLIPNLIMDVGTHFQPSPGKFNVTHPFYTYRQRLEEYYLKGWEQRPTLQQDINTPHSETPYLICNGALANSPLRSRSADFHDAQGQAIDGDGRPIYASDTHNFEFTRLRCGSPLIGWVPTASFDRTVADVTPSSGQAKTAEVLAGPTPFWATKPFPLSSAVAASGAALDSAGVNSLRAKVALNTVLGMLNANLRYQTANFAQNRTEWWRRPSDRLREVTADRFIRSPHSNVLQISDGAHFENLGVFALLRRNVPLTLAFDAGQDEDYTYSDLRRLLFLIQQYGWSYTSPTGSGSGRLKDESQVVLPAQFTPAQAVPGQNGAPQNPLCHFIIQKPSQRLDLWYVKNSFRTSDLARPEAHGLTALLPAPPDQPGAQEHDEKYLKVMHDHFPHINTLKLQGWNQPRFDAYREIGQLLARRVAAEARAQLPK